MGLAFLEFARGQQGASMHLEFETNPKPGSHTETGAANFSGGPRGLGGLFNYLPGQGPSGAFWPFRELAA